MAPLHRVLFASAVLTMTMPLASSACPPFEPASTIAVGPRPDALAAGDVNGDGFPDLVVANDYDVMVLFGDGAGSFAPGPRTPVVAGPRTIVLTNLNGDSRLDLVVAGGHSFGDELQLLLGNGNGTFTSRQTFVGNTSQDLTTGDFNGDGHADIAIIDMDFWAPNPPSGGYANIYLGNGDGTVHFGGRYATLDIPSSIITSDFNGDGRADLAVRCNAGVAVLLGNGDGSFGSKTGHAMTGAGIAAGDVDGDGRIDLVAAAPASDGASVLLGDGNGAFGIETLYPSGDGPWSAAVVDLFGRGVVDVLTADLYGNTVSLLPGLGDGSVGPPMSFAVGNSPTAILVADFDRDSRPDVAAANFNSDTVSVLLGRRIDLPWIAFETPETIVWQAVPGALAYHVYRGAVADLVDANADGLPDGGYGQCFDAHDPDRSDTALVDAETPPAGAAFFYLASVVGSGGDQGIGVTGACLARTPTSVCP